ncbi:MAG: hypothetical protein HKN32_09765, partial [Flavobacteriales bacterium]|nr:hypothetical protein [Flavobacteriales bacterium]
MNLQRTAILMLIGMLPFVLGSFQPRIAQDHLGFNLMPHWPGSLNTFGIVKTFQGKMIDFNHLSEKEFILVASGLMKCPCNPDGKNFFEEFQVPRCEAWWDQPFAQHEFDCPTINNLWKLRFSKRPGSGNLPENSTESGYSPDRGWAKTEFGPSKGQLQMLNSYGIKDLDDFAVGDKCFELIKS